MPSTPVIRRGLTGAHSPHSARMEGRNVGTAAASGTVMSPTNTYGGLSQRFLISPIAASTARTMAPGPSPSWS